MTATDPCRAERTASSVHYCTYMGAVQKWRHQQVPETPQPTSTGSLHVAAMYAYTTVLATTTQGGQAPCVTSPRTANTKKGYSHPKSLLQSHVLVCLLYKGGRTRGTSPQTTCLRTVMLQCTALSCCPVHGIRGMVPALGPTGGVAAPFVCMAEREREREREREDLCPFLTPQSKAKQRERDL